MKNCFLLTMNYPFAGGETFLETEIEYLARKFDSIYIFVINKNNKGVRRNIPSNCRVYSIGAISSKWRYPLYVIKGLCSGAKDLCIDRKLSFKRKLVSFYYRGRGTTVYTKALKIINKYNLNTEECVFYSYWFMDQAYVAWKLAEYFKGMGRKCEAVSRGHGYDVYWEANSAGWIPFQDTSASHLKKVYICSEKGKDYLSKKYPQLIDKFDISRLGVSRLGKADADYNIKCLITCSSLIPLKRVELLAAAYNILRQEFTKLRWICIGDGPCKNKIEDILLDDSDVFFTGNIPNSEVKHIYASCPISYFINLSTSEGVPVSIMEALSYGIPCIATDVGGNSELVNNLNGRLIIDAVSLTPERVASVIKDELSLPYDDWMKKRQKAEATWAKLADADICYTEWSNILYNL